MKERSGCALFSGRSRCGSFDHDPFFKDCTSKSHSQGLCLKKTGPDDEIRDTGE